MLILDGKACATARRELLKSKVAALKGSVPGLAVVLVGDDPASQVYVKNKIAACEEVGFKSFLKKLPETASFADVEKTILALNSDSNVTGILLQLPLPKGLDAEKLISKIDPKKDADCLTPENIGLFYSGQPRTQPCTPAGIMTLLQHHHIKIAGMNAVVVGRSHIVGQPMAQMLLKADATVTICHSKTKSVGEVTRFADLVVVAAGRPLLLGREDFKEGSVVVDVGVHRNSSNAPGEKKLVGDVRFGELEGHCRAITPVPGGVGPMTIQSLLENTWKLSGH